MGAAQSFVIPFSCIEISWDVTPVLFNLLHFGVSKIPIDSPRPTSTDFDAHA
jgi:hypothetical protein